METLDALRGKRDTRSYRPDPVADEVLDRVLDAARMAGSAKNTQPVRVVVVTDQADKSALKAGGDFASWIDRPPVLVVMTVRSDAGPRRLFDVGRHSQNLMVAAHAEGLASCPVTFHHQDVVRPILGLPDDVEAPMVMTLGWPGEAEGESPIAGPRVPFGDYVSRGRWA
ncbi:MAG: hypothetical protein GY745_05405 [Actinomycetia bacterium]|nr:hypothetical protein [Actinomycetes bacterium]MCP3910742.1 hypothetical protein [Actinomycetes bacterium]MCP4084472.1 hypothetical protein [Actinomycetes bacterium]